MRRAGADQPGVPRTMKRSISAPCNSTQGSGASPHPSATSHRRLAAHSNERARAHEAGSARWTTTRAKAPARSSTPRGTQADRSQPVIQHIY